MPPPPPPPIFEQPDPPRRRPLYSSRGTTGKTKDSASGRRPESHQGNQGRSAAAGDVLDRGRGGIDSGHRVGLVNPHPQFEHRGRTVRFCRFRASSGSARSCATADGPDNLRRWRVRLPRSRPHRRPKLNRRCHVAGHERKERSQKGCGGRSCDCSGADGDRLHSSGREGSGRWQDRPKLGYALYALGP